MARITWTSEAESWLTEIFTYIFKDNAAAAQRVVNGIVHRAEALIEFPRLGHRYEDIVDREVRILLFAHYRIAYWVKEDGNVAILGVYHGAIDISRRLH